MTHPLTLTSGRSNGAAFDDVLLSRRSVRAFLPTPVDRALVTELLALAGRCASNSNVQPWHTYVLTGGAKERLTAAVLRSYDETGRVKDREYDYQPDPDGWAEPFKNRRETFGEGLYGRTLGVPFEDMELRDFYHRRNYDFFGAPVGLIITVSRHPRLSALVDAGIYLQSLMLAARSRGLDTCAQASFIDFHPALRRELSIPDDRVIVCGMSLGYADTTHRLDGHRTTREPVESMCTFMGDD